MNQSAIKKTQIIRELFHIPDDRLDNVQMCIDSILNETSRKDRSKQSLKGIWKDKGFERIADLESEIKKTREKLSGVILKRQF